MSQPQLSDEVRDWYWQLIERFKFIYDFNKNLTLKTHANLILVGYRLISLLGCGQLAMTRSARDVYFRCGDMIVKYWAEFAPEPKRQLRKRIEELEEKLKGELFSLQVVYLLFNTTIGLGTQPTIESALGRYRIQRILLVYETAEPKARIYLRWQHTSAKVYPFEFVEITFHSSGAYEIDYDVVRKKENDERAITILTETYNNRGKLVGYINRAHDFLAQLVKGLTTYLLY